MSANFLLVQLDIEKTPNKRGIIMPAISMFYGILILMYFYDNKKHSMPHIHAEYDEHEVSIAIEDGTVLSGSLPPGKMK